VALTIDGINSLAFSQNKSFRDLGMWVIAARSNGVVRGWHDIGNQSFQFNVMEIAKAPAAAFGASEQVGVITATFCAAFENNLPPAELIPGLRDQVATGKGPPIEQPLRDAVRAFGAVHVVRGAIYSAHRRKHLSGCKPDLPAESERVGPPRKTR
jgi:hypothetical protein